MSCVNFKRIFRKLQALSFYTGEGGEAKGANTGENPSIFFSVFD
ncbi:hypothetical protein D920_00961 [Enterococcus faecalis 13-SD-W-01]|nr:hypothetical protein D920_00961 [Enterococcus faecalis 13-SD-W-01]